MKFKLLLVTSLFLTGMLHAQSVFVSVEINRNQTGDSTLTYQDTFFDAAVEDYSITGATLSATSGVLTTPVVMTNDGTNYGYRDNNVTAATIFGNYPNDATYTITTTGTDNGTVNIAGPNTPYGGGSTIFPVAPLFTIAGVTGGWSGNTFTFNPTGVTSFTISMNAYSDGNSGGNFGYGFSVEDGGSELGNVGGGPFTSGDSYTTPVFSFTNGAAADAGDADSETYGFIDGTNYRIEGNFSNVFNFGATGTGALSGIEAFIVSQNTSFNLVADSNFSAVPEPGTFGLFAGLIGLGIAGFSRRRNTVR